MEYPNVKKAYKLLDGENIIMEHDNLSWLVDKATAIKQFCPWAKPVVLQNN